MELWIRSQDKKILTPINEPLCLIEGEYHDGWKEQYTEYEIHYKNSNLGTYKSKERALKVLDKISTLIKNKYIVEINGLIHPEEQARIAKELATFYEGEFIIQPLRCDIKPINPNATYYQMPEK